MTATKTCSKCRQTKPLDEYYRDKSNGDGKTYRCKVCIKAHSVEYHVTNGDAIRMRKTEHYARNRAAIMAYKAEYRAENHHKWWEYAFLRRAERYGLEPVVESFTLDDLVAEYGDQCWHCGGPFEELDHYPVAVVHGGTHTLENCKPSCAACNSVGTAFRRQSKGVKKQ